MSDSLAPLTLQKRSTPPSANDGLELDDNKGWTDIATNIPATATSYSDSSDPPVYYRLKQPTLLGEQVPYGVKQLTASATGSVAWAKRFGGALNESGQSVAVDPTGNIFVLYFFKGTANFGGTDLTATGNQSNIAIVKYNSAGVFQWQKPYGGTGTITPKAISLDPSGNILICGFFSEQGNFGGSSTTTGTPQDIAGFIAKYNSLGEYQWDKTFPSSSIYSGAYNNQIRAITSDSSGNVIMSGSFTGTANFGGGDRMTQYNITPQMILAKYDPAGTHLWSKSFVSQSESYGNVLAIDANDNIIVGGDFKFDLNLASNDAIDRTIRGSCATYFTGFIGKFNSAGVNQWVWRRGGHTDNSITAPGDGNCTVAQGNHIYSIALDTDGNIVVGGNFYKHVDLGGGLRTGGGLEVDGFVAKYLGTTGAYVWDLVFVGDQACYVQSVDTDGANNVYAVGYYRSQSTDFQGVKSGSVVGSYDGFVIKRDSAGSFKWFLSIGGSATDGPQCLAVDPVSQSPIVSGAFNQTCQFGSISLTSVGLGDAFLMRMNP